MKIVVDKEICSGQGRCHATVPSLYPLDEDGFSIADGSAVPADQSDDAQRGANSCPETAIRLLG
jgi:ferredoxin